MSKQLSGQIALVTGASRGIGRGIALQLGKAGATVYITGRQPKDSSTVSALNGVANEITKFGGHGIALYCDHSNDQQVESLFKKIATEQNNQLDILVNNAYSAVDPYTNYDEINNVGLRNHYICTVLGAKLMVPKKKGLIVTISSLGGLRYLFNVPYGIGKAACDRMAADTAIELRDFNVTHVSLCPGAVRTETVIKMKFSQKLKEFFVTESPEFSGQCIVSLAADKNVLSKTGLILFTSQLGEEYNLVDEDGSKQQNFLSPQLQKFVAELNKVRTFNFQDPQAKI